MQRFQRLAAATLAAAAVATGATAVAASPAEARIASGKYWYTGSQKSGEQITRQPVTVRGSQFQFQGSPQVFFIHHTRRGGWFDANGARINLRRSGNGYTGTSSLPFTSPSTWARITLTPR